MSVLRTTLLSRPIGSSKPAKKVLSRRYHLHSGGVFYIVVTVLLGIGSINSQNNLLFIVFGVALGAMLVSGVISGAMMVGLEVVRRPVAPAQVGANARFSYRLTNTRKRVPAMAIDLIEADRPRRKLRRRQRGTAIPEAFVELVPPASTVDVVAVMPCTRRGVMRLDPITVSTMFPFGIVLKSVTVTEPDEVLVLPRLVELPDSVLLSGGGRGRYETERHDRKGLGLEFYAIREYQPGDPMRRIAWKQSARSGTLRTREFASPVATSVLIDVAFEREGTSFAREEESEGERVICLAASLAALAARLGVSTGLRISQLGIDIPPSQVQGRLTAILDVLARVELDDPRLGTPAVAGEVPAESRLFRVQSARSDAASSPSARVLTPDLLDEVVR
ncbi:MAG: DUF58 domain-containing protein [Phycisphaerales bacterium JB050]